MNSKSLDQLNTINKINGILTSSNIEHWLHGGWAVDFLLGKVSREHSDVEIIIWHKDRDDVKDVLSRSEFTEIATDFPVEGFEFTDNLSSVRIHFVYIDTNSNGEVVSLGRWSNWPWPEDSFSGFTGNIGKVQIPIVSPSGQLDSKSNYSKHEHGTPLRDKDQEDIVKLQKYIETNN